MRDFDVTPAPDEPRGRRPPFEGGRLAASAIAIPIALVAIVAFICFVTPVIFPLPPPTGGDVTKALLPVSAPAHPLGTDLDGNDVWARLVYGGRNSLIIAIAVNAVGLVAGASAGAMSGYIGGRCDNVIMRMFDVVIAFPSLILVLAISEALGPSRSHTIMALLFFSIPAFARVARSNTVAIRSGDFIVAAELCGSRPQKILCFHIMPHIIPSLLTFMLLGMGVTINIEGALSFLGLGVPPPSPSWGNMIAQGQLAVATRPTLLLFPSLFLVCTVLALNWLGDALRRRWSLR